MDLKLALQQMMGGIFSDGISLPAAEEPLVILNDKIDESFDRWEKQKILETKNADEHVLMSYGPMAPTGLVNKFVTYTYDAEHRLTYAKNLQSLWETLAKARGNNLKIIAMTKNGVAVNEQINDKLENLLKYIRPCIFVMLYFLSQIE